MAGDILNYGAGRKVLFLTILTILTLFVTRHIETLFVMIV